MKIPFWTRIFSASAYLLGFPALYIILTYKNNEGYIRRHASQAFLLWVMYFTVFFMIRFLIDFLWARAYNPQLDRLELLAVFFMGGYAFFCAFRTLLGKEFRIPY